jgi:hypothetical protein
MMKDVPLIVTDEAAAHVARLGLQRALEQNLDWVRQNVENLQGIHVELFCDRVYSGGRTLVFINAHYRPPGEPPFPFIQWDWAAWAMKTLSPEALDVFRLSPAYHPMLNKSA